MPDGIPTPRKKRRWLRWLAVIFGVLAVTVFLLLRDEELKPADDLMPQRPAIAWDDNNGWKRLEEFARTVPEAASEEKKRFGSIVQLFEEPAPAELDKSTLTDAQLSDLEAISAIPLFQAKSFPDALAALGYDSSGVKNVRYCLNVTIVAATERGAVPLILRCVRIGATLQKKETAGATSIISYMFAPVWLENAVIARSLVRVDWSEAELKELAGLLTDDPVKPDELFEAMRQEFRLSLTFLMQLEDPPNPPKYSSIPRFLFQRNRTANLLAKETRECLALSLTAPWSSIEARRKPMGFSDWIDPNLNGRGFVEITLNPGREEFIWRRANATRRAMQVIVALHRFQKAHGSVPDSLTALVPDFLPAVPLDPYNLEPLHWNAEHRVVQDTGTRGKLAPISPGERRLIRSEDYGGGVGFRTKAEEDARRAAPPRIPGGGKKPPTAAPAGGANK